jgi:hypothetical protein
MHRCLTANAVSDESAGTSVLDPVTLRGSSNILKSALIHVAMRVQFVVAAPQSQCAPSLPLNTAAVSPAECPVRPSRLPPKLAALALSSPLLRGYDELKVSLPQSRLPVLLVLTGNTFVDSKQGLSLTRTHTIGLSRTGIILGNKGASSCARPSANRAALRYTPNCNATVLMVETTHRKSGWRAVYGKHRFQECPVD